MLAQEEILASVMLAEHLFISFIRHPKTAIAICVPGSPDSAFQGAVGLKSFLSTLNDASGNSFDAHGWAGICSNKKHIY